MYPVYAWIWKELASEVVHGDTAEWKIHETMWPEMYKDVLWELLHNESL